MDDANRTVEMSNDLKSIDSNDVILTDTELGVDEDETSFESLNNKIISSSDEINLTHDYSFNEENDIEYTDGIVISKSITINGNGFTIDAKGIARIFNITSPDVTLKNMTFLNAFHDKGGSLYITGKDCNIMDCSFINNKATVEASAIYLVAPHGQIINSKIINCSCDLYTGAVLVNSANASVIGCHFENNSAKISAGAIGWAAKDNGIIRDCVFINNSAYNEGGGAIFWNKGKNGIIQNSTFRNNYANFNGSAIFWSFGENGKIIDSIFVNNEANVTGGAIYLKGDNNEMNNCNFTNNTAGKNGGAIYWLGNMTLISHCNLLDNSAEDGGALWIGGDNCTITNSIFQNNSANDSAGAVYIENGDNLSIVSSGFYNNNCTFAGAIYLSYALNSKITYCDFKDNTATENNGGAMYFKYVDNYTLSYSNFTNNTAYVDGGGIYTSNGEYGLITHCNFNNNTAIFGSGGALNWNNPKSNLTYCNFTNNHAFDSGAIDTLNPNGRITNCNFIKNSAESAGGAISFYGSNGFVYECNFINNAAPSASAGAVYWLQSSTNGTIANCNFTGNVGGWGGAVRWESSNNGSLINCRFLNCSATKFAGAVYWRSSKYGEVSNCTFMDCNGASTGGAVYWRDGAFGLLSNCTFKNTTAEAGSAVYWSGDDGQILNCNFNNVNTDSRYSGVIEISSADVDVKYCTVKDSNSFNSLYADGYYRISGLIGLEKNEFDGFIRIMDGGITSPTYLRLTGENGYPSGPVELKAVIQDDNENIIIINKKLTFIISDGSEIQTSCVDGSWSATHTFNKTGEYFVTANISNFDNLTAGDIKVQIGQSTKFVNITISDDLKITVVLVNDLGLPIGNANVTFNIDNVTYNTTSDNSGLVMIQSASNKTVTISYPGDDEYIPTSITMTLKDITPTKTDAKFNIDPRQVIKIYAVDYSAGERGNDIGFKLTDVEGNPIAGAEVTLAFKTSVYNRITDADGYAYIEISTSESGNSLCVLSFVGDSEHNAVVVPFTFNVAKKTITIKAKKKTFKAKTKTKKFTVTLKTKVFNSKNKKIYLKKGKKVTLKIKGKTFNAKTNAKGEATFKIKKLTKKGKYTAKIRFAGDATYKSASKSVKIIIK